VHELAGSTFGRWQVGSQDPIWAGSLARLEPRRRWRGRRGV